jgi:diaminopimelate decarboxylase
MGAVIEFDGVDAMALAARIGTPAYVLSRTVFKARLDGLRSALESVWPCVACFYSMKANANPWLLREALEAGWGLDACSEGDLFLADEVGAGAEAITFTGVGLDPRALSDVRARVRFLNIDHLDDLRVLTLPRGSRVGLRLAPVVVSGAAERDRLYASRKFGLTAAEVPEALTVAQARGLIVEGLHCHPGSSVTDIALLRDTLDDTFTAALRAGAPVPGAWTELSYIDVGGGIGVSYDADAGGVTAKAYAAAMSDVMSNVTTSLGREPVLQVEPGEWLVSPAGALLTRVIRVAERDGVRVAVVDASLNQYVGTSLYRPNNAITVIGAAKRARFAHDVFGCTNSPDDRFCAERELPELERGDLLAIHCTGGYGYARGGRFNEHPQAPEVFVSGSRYAVLRKREGLGVLVEGVPARLDWLDA